MLDRHFFRHEEGRVNGKTTQNELYCRDKAPFNTFIREFTHATFLSRGRQPEVRCLVTTTFTLLSILPPLETIRLKVWQILLSWHAKCSFPRTVRGSKTSRA